MKYGSNGCELSTSAISAALAKAGERGGGRAGAYQVDKGSAMPPQGHYADTDLPHPKARADETGN